MNTEKITITEKITFRKSSGKGFADFGLEDAADLIAKAELALAIRKRIEQKGLNQTQAAELLNTTQARISELYNAKVMKMTFDRLLGFLNALDVDACITVSEREVGVSEKQERIVVKEPIVVEEPVGAITYVTHDGSALSVEMMGGQGQLTERLGLDAQTAAYSQLATYDIDPERLRKIMEMFKDRSQTFLNNNPIIAGFGDDTGRLSAGDCAYIAAILKKAVEQA